MLLEKLPVAKSNSLDSIILLAEGEGVERGTFSFKWMGILLD
jgi:hypothetical protein